jgi:predicted ribosomally synthesized peptide with nif11-like leader
MSIEDLERLMRDLRNDPELMREFQELGGDREAWVRWGRDRGYRFGVDEAEGLVRSRDEMSDDDLEQVAGGWDGGGSGSGSSGP